MKVRIGADQTQKLRNALAQAGQREIGGQLFGEQLAPSDFLVKDLAIQTRRGSFTRFVVDQFQAARNAMHFFDRTKHQYTRHNYIGEWHSHPSFSVRPSGADVATMWGLVRDPEFKGNFAALMIVRLDVESITAGAWLFDPAGREFRITMDIDND